MTESDTGATDPFPGWDWEDPDGLAAMMDDFTASIAACETVELVADTLPTTRDELAAAGISGIEFAAFRTAHPNGLGTDIVPAHAAALTAERGGLYRVNGTSFFTPLDIRDPLPFADGAVDWVYAEHLIEHVPMPVAVGWLREVHRVLAPGGLLRLTTPDLRTYVDGYAGTDFYLEHRTRLRDLQVGPPMPDRRAFMFNQIFYLYGHRWLYDEAELRYVLGRAGFEGDAMRVAALHDGSRPDVAGLDVAFRDDETIYVEVNR